MTKETLSDTDIKVGSRVRISLGFENNESKLAETRKLLNNGVDELEVVINLRYEKGKKHS